MASNYEQGINTFSSYSKNGKKGWWICGEGHEWNATLNKRSKGTECPKCYSDRRSLKKRKA